MVQKKFRKTISIYRSKNGSKGVAEAPLSNPCLSKQPHPHRCWSFVSARTWLSCIIEKSFLQGQWNLVQSKSIEFLRKRISRNAQLSDIVNFLNLYELLQKMMLFLLNLFTSPQWTGTPSSSTVETRDPSALDPSCPKCWGGKV